MTKFIVLSATALALALGGVSTASAAAGDLAKCYDRVIVACNKTNHATSCAESGMDQCDEVYPTPLVLPPTQSLSSGSSAPSKKSVIDLL